MVRVLNRQIRCIVAGAGLVAVLAGTPALAQSHVKPKPRGGGTEDGGQERCGTER